MSISGDELEQWQNNTRATLAYHNISFTELAEECGVTRRYLYTMLNIPKPIRDFRKMSVDEALQRVVEKAQRAKKKAKPKDGGEKGA